MAHKGQRLKSFIEQELGISKAALARKIKKHSNTIYNWYKNPNLDDSHILFIGKQLNLDMTRAFPSLANMIFPENIGDQQVNYTSLTECQKGYSILITKYNRLMEKHIELLELMRADTGDDK